MHTQPNLGHLPAREQQRDAIHIALAPVIAGDRLDPGTHVILRDGKAYATTGQNFIGCVDPFLWNAVNVGQTFWLLLNPQSITSLRHEWTHPAFRDQEGHDKTPSSSEVFLREWAKKNGRDYDQLIEILGEAIDEGGAHGGNNDQADRLNEDKAVLLAHASVLLGKVVTDIQGTYFSCAC